MNFITQETLEDIWKQSGFHMLRFFKILTSHINSQAEVFIATLEQENKQLRARNERLEKESNAG